MLAEKLGVTFYDKVLIRTLEKKFNLTVEEIEHLKAQKKRWWADFMRISSIGHGITESFSGSVADAERDVLTTEMIFRAEKEILLEIAHEESCVIAGRMGFSILKDHPNNLSILILASKEHRLARVMRKKGLNEKDAMKLIDKVDRMREEYVKNFAHTSRYEARNYDMVIRMDGKTEEEVVDVILKYIG
jgi:cytidylate kinase